jgi:ribosome recycling factor
MPINQVATVSVPEPRLLSVQVGTVAMSAGRKGDPHAGLGINPIVDGQ